MKLSSFVLLSALAAASGKKLRAVSHARKLCELKTLEFSAFDGGEHVYNDQLAELGFDVAITIESSSWQCYTAAPVVFDTANPTCNDHDLGSDLPEDQKAIIIHEDSSGCKPDDCAQGGAIIFTFDHPVKMEDIRIMDMDEPVHLFVQKSGAGSENWQPLADPPLPGDGKHVTYSINENDVTSLKVAFQGSGGIPYLTYLDCPANPTASGDPHFVTWSKSKFDYHGMCDLQLIESQKFGNGLGLDVQVRTTQRSWYSFIETAAVRIGNDVLEVGTHGIQYLNGNSNIDFANEEAPANLAGYPIKYNKYRRGKGGKERVYEIHLSEHEYIHIRAYKDFLFVSLAPGIYLDLHDAQGLMGDWEEGKMLARDGKTVIQDANAFGAEWQVREGSLFQDARAPQYPMECVAAPPVDTGRKLKESKISRSTAEEACKFAAGKRREECIFDVMVVGDLDLA